MQWLEIAVDAHSGGTEALCNLLETLDVSGLVVEDEQDLRDFAENGKAYWDELDADFLAARKGLCRVKYYLSDDPEGRAIWANQRVALEQAGYAPVASPLRDEDWENNWKQYYRPMEVGQRLLIVPEWETVPPAEGRTPLRLDPGLSFGTGSHPSTRMCLEALEPLAPQAKRVLDLGCGSGILAIAALVLGAETALGCDIDEKAPSIAAANAARNGVADRLTVLAGDAIRDEALRSAIGGAQYDLILMNIVADVILRLCGSVLPWLAPGGRFLCSGIIDGREDEVRAGLEAGGLEILSHRRLGDWHAFAAKLGGAGC